MKKVKYLPSSLDAVEHLRYDVDAMSIKFYTLPDAPTGIFHPKYSEKCYTFAAGISGDGANDYLVLMALRPDWETTGDGKVLDIDTAAFCFKADDTSAAPSGIALFHQSFDGRTTPLVDYEAFTLEETVNDLHSKLMPGSLPLSASPPIYINAMAHSIAKFNELLNPEISVWKDSFSKPDETFDALWAYCSDNGRVIPKDWKRLYEMLANKRQSPSGGWVPSLPLILAAWDTATPIEKQMRFKEHVEWAGHNSQIDEIGHYLRSLSEEDWYHYGEL
ncbi:MAG: hypothetical protein IAE94_10885 [Chthoniobacterales bacterium]|nr:hypothetical protein [Chthoniobacterales bacterium]